jgi:hypothetical protein
MRKKKAFEATSLVLLLLAIVAWQCGAPTPTPTLTPTSTISPTPTATPTHTPTPTPILPARCPEAISPEEAIAYVGGIKTVQGMVVDSYWASASSGRPTFLNFCRPYPDHCFTALIWEDQRQQFIGCLGGEPEVVLLNREVCVKGLVELYQGKPQIILRECHQLEVIR